MPVADGLAEIDAIEQRGGERLDRGALFGEDALALFLEEAAEVLDDQVFGRIGADAVAVELAGPLAGELFFLARLQAEAAHAPFGAGQAAAETDPPRVEPDLFARNIDGRDIADRSAADVARGGFPDFPGVVVVDDGAGGDREIEERGGEIVVGEARLRV